VRTSTAEVNRRHTVRYAMDLPCRLTVAGQGTHAARVVDIGEGGAAVQDGPKLPAGTRGTLEADRIGLPLAFAVRASEGDALHLVFELDEAAASKLTQLLEHLGLRRAA